MTDAEKIQIRTAFFHQQHALLNLLIAGNADLDGIVPIEPARITNNIVMPREIRPANMDEGESLKLTNILEGSDDTYAAVSADVERNLAPPGLFDSSIARVIASDMSNAESHAHAKSSVFQHLLGPLDDFVSRFVPLYSVGKDVHPRETNYTLQTNRRRMLAVVKKYLLAAFITLVATEDDALSAFRNQLLKMREVANAIYTGKNVINKLEIVGEKWPLTNTDNYELNNPLCAKAVLAFFEPSQPKKDIAMKLGGLDSRVHWLKLAFSQQLINLAGIEKNDHVMVAGKEVIRKCATNLGNNNNDDYASVVATLFAVHIDAPTIVMGRLKLDAWIPEEKSRRVVGAPPYFNEYVGLQNHRLLGNRVLQLIDQSVAPFSNIKKEDFDKGDLSKLSIGGTHLVNTTDQDDVLLFNFTRDYVRAISRRMLGGNYCNYELTLFLMPQAPVIEHTLWKIATDQKQPTPDETNASTKFDRGLRPMFFAMWHRFFGKFPDPVYANAVIEQRTIRDGKTLSNVVGVDLSTLLSMLPSALYDRAAAELMAEHISRGMQAARSTDLIQKQTEPAPSLGGSLSAATTAVTLVETTVTKQQDPDLVLKPPVQTSPPPSPPHSVTPTTTTTTTTSTDIASSHLYYAPGNTGKNALVLGDVGKFMSRVLNPLYETSTPEVSSHCMAFALRWVLGIGFYKAPTLRARIDGFPLMNELASRISAVDGVDYITPTALSGEWTVLAEAVDDSAMTPVTLTPVLNLDKSWSLKAVHRATNKKIMITIEDAASLTNAGRNFTGADVSISNSGFFVLLVIAMFLHTDDKDLGILFDEGTTNGMRMLQKARIFQPEKDSLQIALFAAIRATIISSAVRAGAANAISRMSSIHQYQLFDKHLVGVVNQLYKNFEATTAIYKARNNP